MNLVLEMELMQLTHQERLREAKQHRLARLAKQQRKPNSTLLRRLLNGLLRKPAPQTRPYGGLELAP